MKAEARVVVIGGGVIGASILYHLAKYGWSDVVLVEKHELTSGSTWMAAGNCSFYHPNYYCAQINIKSVEIYKQLEKETGQSAGWHTTGAIRLADNEERMDELRYNAVKDRCLGLNVEMLSPEEIGRMHPLINTEGLLGGLYHPDDGDVDPNSVTQAMASGARKYGGEINQHTIVKELEQKRNGEWIVRTDKGDITCEWVVNAAGLWAPEVAKMAGIKIPSIAIEHSHILFETISAVADRETMLPLIRDPDRSIYVRQEMDSLILGMYESHGEQWHKHGVPWDYALQELPVDLDRIMENVEHGMFRFPVMAESGMKHTTVGPITYTPNGDPLVGPAYPLKNFFHACGYSFGITQAGGVGHYIAGWMMNGEPEIDLWPIDSRRYGSYANWGYNTEKIADTYPRLYAIYFPNEWRKAARPNRVAPIYPYQKAANASFGDYYGWECPNYFVADGESTEEIPSWRRSNGFRYVGQECRNVMNNVGLLDLSRFVKTEISGPGAEAWLNWMTCQKVPTKEGRIALCPMLDRNGNFKSDMTVVKIGTDSYYCVTASVGKRHDQHWMMENLPADGSVRMRCETYQTGCLVIAGPNSRKVLERATEADLSDNAFAFGTSRELYLGRVKCRVNRMNYVGELGYEIFHPIESQIPLYELLTECGEEFDMKMFGMYAMESMRLEKGYLAWKSEMNVHHTPLETNIGWTVKMDKDFIGKAGLERQKAEGVGRTLVCMEVAADDADAYGYNGIYWNGKPVGMTSSGGYGHRTEKSIALGYVDNDAAKIGTEVEIDILNVRRSATVVTMPIYDPGGKRMKV